jgi:hypothetical protein
MARLKVESDKKPSTRLSWQEIDKIALRAEWHDAKNEFRVFRKHNGVVRGEWTFTYVGKNSWKCLDAGARYLRNRRYAGQLNPREVDKSQIPEDVELMARKFITESLELKPKL